MLNLKNITKTYKDKKIFQNATFEAQLGEIVLLTGKSGIGKSTLLDIIAGIKEYDSGTYYYQGIEMLPKDDEKMSAFRNEYIEPVFSRDIFCVCSNLFPKNNIGRRKNNAGVVTIRVSFQS